MSISRRQIVGLLAGSGIASRLLAKLPRFEVDRLAGECVARRPTVRQRQYRASATISLFSIPCVSKSGVGCAFALVEEAAGPEGGTVSIQFGAGSWPECARGFNRLGYIQEVVRETREGSVEECAYLAFM